MFRSVWLAVCVAALVGALAPSDARATWDYYCFDLGSGSTASASGTPRIDRVLASQKESFQILRAPQAEGDAQGKGGGLYGSNLELARTVRSGGVAVAVVPGQDAICPRITGGGTCASVESAARGHLYLTHYEGERLVSASILVPDGISEVSVVSGGETRQVKPERNVVILTDPSASNLSYELDGRKVSINF